MLATALQLSRQPGVPAHDTLWAEDGQVFLADALHDGPVDALTEPLAGYLHLVPRMLGAVASVLPLRAAAAVFGGGTAVIVALLSVYVFVASRRILPAVWARAALAGLSVLLPATTVESANTAANLHFYLPLPVLLALLDRPSTLRRALVPIAIVLLATLSDPRLGLLLPVALVVLWRSDLRPSKVVSAVFLVALALQVVVVLGSRLADWDPTAAQYPVRLGDSSVIDVPRLYGLRVVGPLLTGERLLDNAWRAFGWTFAFAALAVAAAVVAVGLARANSASDRRWIVALVALSAIFFTTHAAAWGTRFLWPHEDFYLAGNRYVQTPMLFLAAAVFVVLGARSPAVPAIVRALRYGFLVLLGALVVAYFRPVILRSQGPSWSRELATATTSCRTITETTIRILIAPRLSGPANWSVPVDCRKLSP